MQWKVVVVFFFNETNGVTYGENQKFKRSICSECLVAHEQKRHGHCVSQFAQRQQHVCPLEPGLRYSMFHVHEPTEKFSKQIRGLPHFREVAPCMGAIHCVSLFVLRLRHKIRISGKIRGEREEEGRCRVTTPQESRDYGVIKRSESWGWSGGWMIVRPHKTHMLMYEQRQAHNLELTSLQRKLYWKWYFHKHMKGDFWFFFSSNK